METFKIQNIELDEKLLLQISNNSGIKLDDIKYTLSRNFLTIDELSYIIKRNRIVVEYAVHRKPYPIINYVYPFSTPLNKGQMCVVVDDLCLDFIKDKLGIY